METDFTKGWRAIVNVGRILGRLVILTIATIYFIIFLYKLQDMFSNNMQTNNKNVAEQTAKMEEMVAQQKKTNSALSCMLRVMAYDGDNKAIREMTARDCGRIIY